MVADVDKQLKKAQKKLTEGDIDGALKILLNAPKDPRMDELIEECARRKQEYVVSDLGDEECRNACDQCEAEARSDFDMVDNRTEVNSARNVSKTEEKYYSGTSTSVETMYSGTSTKSVVNKYNETKVDLGHVDEQCPGSSGIDLDEPAHIHNNLTKPKVELVNANEKQNQLIGALQNCLKIRAKVLLMGIETLDDNPNVKPEVDTKKIKLEIEYLLRKSHDKFYKGEFVAAQNVMSTAENWFRHVLPKRKPKLDNATNIESNASDQHKPENVSEPASTVVVREITVKGDEFDVAKWLKVAEKALNEGRFERAEKMIAKANAIFHTDNARKLTEQVRKAKAEAKAAEEKSKPEAEKAYENKEYIPRDSEKPVDPEAASTDTNSAKLCLATAQKAYDSKDFKKAHKFLLKAKNIDPNDEKVQEMLKDVEVILSYKKKWLDDHIKNAEEAMRRKHYKEAERILLDALTIDSTSDIIKDMLTEVKDNIEQIRKTVETLVVFAEDAKKKEFYIEAREYLLQINKIDPSYRLHETLKFVEGKIKERQNRADTCMRLAEFAVSKKDFVEAEKRLLIVKDLKIGIDVEDNLKFVRGKIANIKHIRFLRSRVEEAEKNESFIEAREYLQQIREIEPNPQIVNEIKRMDDKISHIQGMAQSYVSSAELAIEQEDFTAAEEMLSKAQGLNVNIDVQEQLKFVRIQIASRSSSQTPDKEDQPIPGVYKDEDCNESKDAVQCEAETIVAEADKAYSENNIAKAKELLEKANLMYVTDRAKELAAMIDASRRFHNYRGNVESHALSPEKSEETINTVECLNKADNAYKEGKLDQALRLYGKAQRIFLKEHKYESQNISEAIEKIKREKRELHNEEQSGSSNTPNKENPEVNTAMPTQMNKEESEKYVEAAVKALDGRNYDKADHLLVEAKRLHHSKNIDELMERVRTARLTEPPEITDDEDNVENNEDSDTSLSVSKYIGFALDMMRKRWYFSAESWLKLANGTHVTPTGTDLVAAIADSLKILSKKSTKEQESYKKVEAKYHLDEATKLLLKNELDEATTFVIVAQNICNTVGKARDIMPMIFKKKFEVVTGKEATKFEGKNKYKFRNYNDADRYNKFMSDCYMEAVSVAAKMKDLNLVKEYLTKCNEMYFSVETKKMLLEVRADNADQSIFRKIYNWVKPNWLKPKK